MIRVDNIPKITLNTMVDRARAQQDDDHESLYEPPVTDEQIDHDVEPTPEDEPWRCEFDD